MKIALNKSACIDIIFIIAILVVPFRYHGGEIFKWNSVFYGFVSNPLLMTDVFNLWDYKNGFGSDLSYYNSTQVVTHALEILYLKIFSFLPSQYTQKIYTLINTALALFFSYKCFNIIYKNHRLATLGAFLYITNPILNQFFIGSYTYSFYIISAFPLILFLLFNAVSSSSLFNKYQFWFVLCVILYSKALFFNIGLFIPMLCTISLILIVNLQKSFSFKWILIRLVVCFSLLIITNLFWILPLINFYKYGLHEATILSSIKDTLQVCGGFYYNLIGVNDPYQWYTILYKNNTWPLNASFILILTSLIALICKAFSDKKYIYLILVYLLLVFICKGSNYPFGNQVVSFYETFPVLRTFALATEKFSFPLVFVYICVILSASALYRNTIVYIALFYSATCLLHILNYPLFSADILYHDKEYSAVHEINNSLIHDINSVNSILDDDDRLLTFPLSKTDLLKIDIDGKSYIGDNFLKNIIKTGAIIDLYHVESGDYAGKALHMKSCDPKTLHDFRINRVLVLKKYIYDKYDDEDINCLQNINTVYKDKLLETENIILLGNEIASTSITNVNYKQNSVNRISPEFYVVDGSSYGDEIKLRFLQNYNENWKIARIVNVLGFYFPLPTQFAPDKESKLFNDFAISLNSLCNGYGDNCYYEDDGRINFKFAVVFLPQYIHYIGLVVSTFVFVLYSIIIYASKSNLNKSSPK